MDIKTLGDQQFKENNFAQAIHYYTLGINSNLNLDRYQLYMNRCLSYFKLDDFKSALSDALEATKLNINSAKAWSRIGSCFIELKTKFPAISAFEQACKLEPENELYTSLLNKAHNIIDNFINQDISNLINSFYLLEPMKQLYEEKGFKKIYDVLDSDNESINTDIKDNKNNSDTDTEDENENNNKSDNLINSDGIPNLQSLITDMYKELPSLPILDENKKDEILSDIQNMNDTKINDIISSVKDNMKNQMSDLFKLVPEIDNKFNEMMNNFMNKDTVLKMTETLFSNDNKMNNLSNIFASDLFKDILNKIKSDQ